MAFMEQPQAAVVRRKTRWMPLVAILLFTFSILYALNSAQMSLNDQRSLMALVALLAGGAVGIWIIAGVSMPIPWQGTDIKASEPIAIGDNKLFVSCGYGVGSILLSILRGGSGEFAVKQVWSSLHLKSKFSNNAWRDGYLYGLDEGTLTCLDAAGGKKHWRGSSYGYGQMLLVDDALLVSGESGVLALVAATPDGFKELARVTALHGKSWTNPALSGHTLLLRNDTEAVGYELP